MKQVILFAGTTEGRTLGAELAKKKIETLLCVATEYGSQLVKTEPYLSVQAGRLTIEEMESLFQIEKPSLVIDTTHPYAAVVTENIQEACKRAGIEYLRLIRDSIDTKRAKDCVVVETVDEAVEYLKTTEGNIFVTTGSKEVHKFTELNDYENRIFARVLSTAEVVAHCNKLGFVGRNLISMQGPFSYEMNVATMKQIDAKYMVTKESGKVGGFEEKLEAALACGAQIILVGRPMDAKGMSFEEGKKFLEEKFEISFSKKEKRKLSLVGIGMGTRENMTIESFQACKEADLILGAGRMLESFSDLDIPLCNTYKPSEMFTYIQEHEMYKNIAIVLSGDVGFYSGAKGILNLFSEEDFDIQVYPGISSVVYFASQLKTAWEDVKLCSTHGRKQNIVAAVLHNKKTFTLLGGNYGVKELCQELLTYGLEDVELAVGTNLHYENEQIQKGSPREFLEKEFENLSVAMIFHKEAKSGITSCILDEDFIRGEAPMTKSEVRSVSVSKLRLNQDSVVYDVGAGTGSVTVEMALQAFEGIVYAVEKKKEAADLILENMKKFKTPNIEVIRGLAPEAMEDLPVPTHAFIGGSSGNLKDILELLLDKNPKVRVVINTVTLETIAEVNECIKTLPLTEVEIVQLQVAKAKKLGSYQLMMGQNPVYIVTCQGRG